MQSNNKNTRVISCTAGGETYFLDMKWVNTVARIEQMEPASGLDGCVGILHLENQSSPIYPLGLLLGRQTPRVAQERVVLLKSALGAWGLLVDDVSQVAEVSAEQISELPPLLGSDVCRKFEGVISLEKGLALLLAPETLRPDSAAAHDGASSFAAALQLDQFVKSAGISSLDGPALNSSQPGNLLVCGLEDDGRKTASAWPWA